MRRREIQVLLREITRYSIRHDHLVYIQIEEKGIGESLNKEKSLTKFLSYKENLQF